MLYICSVPCSSVGKAPASQSESWGSNPTCAQNFFNGKILLGKFELSLSRNLNISNCSGNANQAACIANSNVGSNIYELV